VRGGGFLDLDLWLVRGEDALEYLGVDIEGGGTASAISILVFCYEGLFI
jgi:hypothetical protein